jgi:hypothetical protein
MILWSFLVVKTIIQKLKTTLQNSNQIAGAISERKIQHIELNVEK